MTLKIMPHGRLQEWVADEKGFFASEDLEYSFLVEGDYGIHTVRRDDSGRSRPAPSRPSRPAATAPT